MYVIVTDTISLTRWVLKGSPMIGRWSSSRRACARVSTIALTSRVGYVYAKEVRVCERVKGSFARPVLVM